MKIYSLKYKMLLPVIAAISMVILLLSWQSYAKLKASTEAASYTLLRGIGNKGRITSAIRSIASDALSQRWPPRLAVILPRHCYRPSNPGIFRSPTMVSKMA